MEKTQVQRVSVKTQEIDLKKSKGRRNNRSEKNTFEFRDTGKVGDGSEIWLS